MGIKRNKKSSRKTHKKEDAPSQAKTGPNILIIKRGAVGPYVHQLMEDLIMLFSPNVIRSIKVLRNTRIKDILAAAGPLHISHTIIFTMTDVGLYMKLCKLSQGPTITFKIQNYCLQKDILANQKNPVFIPSLHELAPPCFLMKNIQPNVGEQHLQLTASSVLKLFTPIVPDKTSPQSVKRCCLLHYDQETEEFDLRQYFTRMMQTSTKKLVTKLVNSKKVPNLSNFAEIEDAFNRDGAASESEAEGETKVDLDDIKINKTQKNSVKLKEAGPRITFKLQKIENGFLGGEVLFNRNRKLTEEEIKQLKEIRQKKKEEKLARKAQQEANVAKKKEAKEAHKLKCLEGMPKEMQERAKLKMKRQEEDSDGDDEDSGEEGSSSSSDEEDDNDAKFYREEVGEEPEEGTFTDRQKRRREKDSEEIDSKKRKLGEAEQTKVELRRAQVKDKFKQLDAKRKNKRPRSFGKRLVKKVKTKLKIKKIKESQDKKSKEAEKVGPKVNKSVRKKDDKAAKPSKNK